MTSKPQPIAKLIEAKKKIPKDTISIPSFVLSDGTIGEMVYDGRKTEFTIFKEGEWRLADRFEVEPGRVFVPYTPDNNLVRHKVVLFPSQVLEYPNEEVLLKRIQAFIHKYVDVSPLFERLAAYYGLFSWIYDDFNELPYLRVLGDAGSGKTRFLLAVGSLCYKPIFASGASTVSPIFRILDIFRGTLLIDEADFQQTDEKAEVTKIFNNGNAKGFPVLRSEPIRGRGEYAPRAYQVYGPKIIATRSLFTDRALESRCLTEEMGHRRVRADIPINLPSTFWEEATDIRNQLLAFRFRHKGKYKIASDLVDRSIEPRLNQVFIPILSIIQDKQTREELKDIARAYHRQFVSDRGMGAEGQILEILAEQVKNRGPLYIKDVAFQLAERYGEELDYKVTPKWVGGVIRRKLHLRTERRRDGYVIAPGERERIAHLIERYGLKDNQTSLDAQDEQTGERVNEMNVPGVAQDPSSESL